MVAKYLSREYWAKNKTLFEPHWFIILLLFLLASLPYLKQIAIPNHAIASRDEYRYAILADELSGRFANTPDLAIPIQHPWGWPVLIYLGRLITGHTITGAHLISSMSALLVGSLSYLLMRYFTGPWVALIIGLLVSTNLSMVMLGDRMLSEPAFMVAYLCGLLVAVKNGGELRRNCWSLAATGLMGVVITAIRTVGIAFPFAALLALWDITWQKREPLLTRRLIGGSLLLITPVVAFLLMTSLASPTQGISPDSGYLRQLLASRVSMDSPGYLNDMWVRTRRDFLQHADDYLNVFREYKLLHPLQRLEIAKALDKSLKYLLAFLSLVGLAWRFWKQRGLIEWFALLYLITFFLWPYFSSRFFLPLLPLLLWFIVWTLLQLTSHRRGLAAVALGIGLVLLVGSLTQSLSRATALRARYDERMANLAAAVSYVQNDFAEIDTLGTYSIFEVYYFAPELPVVRLPVGADAYAKALVNKRVTYVLSNVSNPEPNIIYQQYSEFFDQPVEFGEFTVYHVRDWP
jgi:hypothetical protein